MPTFYEGEPIGVIRQELDPASYRAAYLLWEQNKSPLNQPGVKAGLCLTAGAVLAALLPWYFSIYGAAWISCGGILLCLSLAVFFWCAQPEIIGDGAGKVFAGNALLGLPAEIRVYRDSVTVENQYETYREYWTDYAKCLESQRFFVLCGGVARELLILKKDAMSEEQRQELSSHFRSEFAARYRFVKDVARKP